MKQLLAVRYYNHAYLFCVGGKLGMLGKGGTVTEEDLEQGGEKRWEWENYKMRNCIIGIAL